MGNFGQASDVIEKVLKASDVIEKASNVIEKASNVIEKVLKQFSLNDFHAWDAYNKQIKRTNFEDMQ